MVFLNSDVIGTSGSVQKRKRPVENMINPTKWGETEFMEREHTKWQELVKPLKKENFKVNRIVTIQTTFIHIRAAK